MEEATGFATCMPPRRKKAAVNEESFGRRLARLRKEAGYSQREFAQEIGISYRMVAYYEAQTDRPPVQLFPVIAKTLGVTTDHLFGMETIPKRARPVSPRLLRKLRKIEELPRREQRALLTTIDQYLQSARKA